MSKNTINTLNVIIDLMNQMDAKMSDKSVTVDKSKLGKEAIFNKEISKGIVLRIVNDGTYSIGGNATKKQKEDYIKELKKITNDSSVGDLEVKDFIYTIIDAIEESIENPTRNDEIKDGTYKILNVQEGKILKDLNKKMKRMYPEQSISEKPEQEKPEQEKPEQEKPEQEKPEQEKPEQEKPEQEKPEQEKPEQEKPEQEKPEQEKPEQEKPEQEKPEQEKPEQEEPEQEKPEQEKPEQEKPEQEKPEQERPEQEKPEQEKPEQEKPEQEKLEQEKPEQEKSEQEKPTTETEMEEFPKGKPSIIFDAIEGKYTLYINGKEMKSLKPEETMSSDVYNSIIKKAAERTECNPSDLQSYLDPSVYMLLSMYDEKNNTHYASNFAMCAAYQTDDEEMPFNLVYRLNKYDKAENLDKKIYKNIEIWAKNYMKQGIAVIRKSSKEKDDIISKDNKKEGIFSNLKSIGVGIFTAIVNFGIDIKAVFKRREKFRELFSRQKFKSLDVPKQKPKETKKKEEKTDNVTAESVLYINQEMEKLLSKEIKPGMEKEDKKKVLLSKVEQMAKARGIPLEDKEGNKKGFRKLRSEIIKYEAKRYEENHVGYVLKESLNTEEEKKPIGEEKQVKEPVGNEEVTH